MENIKDSINMLTVHTDGGARGNPGPAGVGILIENQLIGESDNPIKISKYIGLATNNQAEYLALIAALKWLRHQVADGNYRLMIWTDSKLVRCQVARQWKTKCVHILELRDEVLELLAPYKHWEIYWHGRNNNVARFGH